MLCKRDDVASLLPRGWLWSPQSQKPLSLAFLPQVELWAAEMRLDAPRILHRFDLLVIGGESDRIFGERRGLVFNPERSFVHPNGDL